jgi:hypothetical protein
MLHNIQRERVVAKLLNACNELEDAFELFRSCRKR